MKKTLYFSLFTIIIFSIIWYKNKTDKKIKNIQLEILTDKDTYENGEWISYSALIANNSKQTIYFKISSCNVEIIGDNGFHAITDIESTSNIYSLKSNSKVKRNLTGYNLYYDFAHVMGIKTFSGRFLSKNKPNSIASLNLNWTTGLSLPEGTYTFTAELLYYNDKTCQSSPKKTTVTKEIHVISDGSIKLEQEILLEDRIRFYAASDKNIYRAGESIRTWGKIEPLEGKWYQWYKDNLDLDILIILINCDTGEEKDIFNLEPGIPPEYTGTYFIFPNMEDEKGIMFYKWLKKEGNYIIRYWLEYLTYETQESKIATIDFPITVIPNESEQTFYSSPSYPVPPFEEYNEFLEDES